MIGRHSGVPLETRGAIARYDAVTDVLEMHGAAKVPHWNRDRLALMFGRKPESVQLFEGHVGGGFGIRGEMYPEDVLVCTAALKFHKPIKWIEDRREHLIAANHSRQQRHKIRAAIDAEGRILGIDDEFFHDNGAYMRTHAATVPDLAAAMLPGPYRVPAYRARRPHPADQQDALRHLPLARPLRDHVRARAADRRHRRQDRHRRHRDPPPQSDRQERDALQPRLRHARHRHHLRLRRLRETDGQVARRRRLGGDAARLRAPARRGRESRLRLCHVRREERARPLRQGAHRGQPQRRGRSRDRCCLNRPRRGDRDRANRRGDAGRRLRQDQSHARPDQPHRQGSRRLRLARHRDVRRGDAHGGGQAARGDAHERRRADADHARRARHRRRRDRAHRHARPVDVARRAGGRAKRIDRRSRIQVEPDGLPLRRAYRAA